MRLLTFLLIVLGFYAAATLLLFLEQRSFIYPAPRAREDIERLLPGLQPVELRTSDGLTLVAGYKPARAGKPTIVFFHGNGDTLRGAVAATARLAEAGYGLLLPEYRGYGGNPGSPSEEGLIRDGKAALDWLARAQVPAARTILVGNSLGSGVATDLASTHTVAGLILISGFSSLPEAAAAHVRFFPARMLVRDRFDNAGKLPRVRAPILLLHGTEDRMIDASHGQRLAGANSRAALMLVPGTGHELAYLPQSQSAILTWLAKHHGGA